MLDFAEIESLSDEITTTLTELDSGITNINNIESINNRVGELLASAKREGIDKGMVKELNQLGFTELEEKYYTTSKSFVGVESIGLESAGGFSKGVLVGVLAIAGTILAFLVGKFLTWLFGASSAISDSSKSSSDNTSVKLDDQEVTITPKTEKIKDGVNIKSLSNMGDPWLKGERISDLLDLIYDYMHNDLTDLISDAKDVDGVFSKIGGYSDFTRLSVKEINNLPKPPSVPDHYKIIIKDTYPIMEEVAGELLKQTPVHGKPSSDESPMTRGLRISGYTNTRIFSKKHFSETIKSELNHDTVVLGATDRDQRELTKLNERLTSFTKKIKVPNENTPPSVVKLYNQIIRYNITQPLQYCTKTISKFIIPLLKTQLGLMKYLAELKDGMKDVIGKAEVDKLLSLVKSSSLTADEKADLVKEINKDITGATDMDSALKSFTKILTLLSDNGTDIGKMTIVKSNKTDLKNVTVESILTEVT